MSAPEPTTGRELSARLAALSADAKEEADKAKQAFKAARTRMEEAETLDKACRTALEAVSSNGAGAVPEATEHTDNELADRVREAREEQPA